MRWNTHMNALDLLILIHLYPPEVTTLTPNTRKPNPKTYVAARRPSMNFLNSNNTQIALVSSLESQKRDHQREREGIHRHKSTRNEAIINREKKE